MPIKKDLKLKNNKLGKEVEEMKNEQIKHNETDIIKEETSLGLINNQDNDDQAENKEIEQKVEFFKINIKQRLNTRTAKGIITIINTVKNGKRLVLSNELVNILGIEQECYVGIYQDGIGVSKAHMENMIQYNLKKMGQKKVIYSSELVEYLTQYFNLNFNNRSCITFSEYKIKEFNENKIVLIQMKRGE